MENTNQSIFRTIFGMMINPSGTIKKALLSTKWYFSVAISGLAFGLFFAQTGLDLYKTGQKNFNFVLLSSGTGVLYGIIAIPLIGLILWVILKMYKSENDMKTTISSFCLSYSGALIYGIVGLLFSLVFGWKTSIAFGVTGVLWAIGPMIVGIREMTKGKNGMSIPIATVISALVLVSWSLFGKL